MPSITHDGVQYIQTRHAMRCKKCGDTIESKSRHDYVRCSCGAIALDGGISLGNRVCGSLCDMEDKSVYRYMDGKKKVYLPSDVLQKRFEEIQRRFERRNVLDETM
jgi:hypothetical protein